MVRQPIVLVAASGLAREVMAAVEAAGTSEVVGILDDNSELHGSTMGGVPVVGEPRWAVEHTSVSVVVCAGSGRFRATIVSRLLAAGVQPERFATVVHPAAVVPRSCQVGPGSVVLPHVTLTADVRVGAHVVIMPNVVLTHDDVVGDFATLCGGVCLGGGVTVGEAAYLGMNATVRQNVRVGERAILGMGSVTIQDVPSDQTWVGVPSAPIARSRAQLAHEMALGTGGWSLP